MIQAVGGVAYRLLREGKKMDIFKLRAIRRAHLIFAYFLAIIYKIDVIYLTWNTDLAYVLILWEVCCITAYVILKIAYPKL